MELNNEIIELSWSNINVVQKKNIFKKLIKNSFGVIKPFSLNVVLGTNGSGKSVLLKCLAGKQKENLKVTGSVLLNGHSVDLITWEKTVGLLTEKLNLCFNQTVKEAIVFAMKMMSNDRTSNEVLIWESEELIRILNLTKVKDEYIKNISVGEARKLSVAILLVKRPNIIIADDLINGLDSFTTINILEIFKQLAMQGKTIIISAKHLTFKMLKYFSKIFLICQGEIIFSGSYEECEKNFKKCGYEIPPNINPIDFFLEIIEINRTSEFTEKESFDRIEKIKKLWQNNKSKEIVRTYGSIKKEITHENTYKKICLIVERDLKLFIRDHWSWRLVLINKTFIMFFLILIYFKLSNTQNYIRSRIGLITFLLLNTLRSSVISTIIDIMAKKKIFVTEICFGMYEPLTYFLAQNIYVLLTLAIPTTICFTIIYWALKLNANILSFFSFLLILILLIVFSFGFSMCVVMCAKSLKRIFLISTAISTIFIMFSGSFVDVKTIPVSTSWLVWLSPFYYAYSLSLKVQLKNTVFGNNDPLSKSIKTGDNVLESMGIDNLPTMVSFSIFLIIVFSFSYTAMLLMYAKIKPIVIS